MNYITHARSNYFLVNDVAAFEALCTQHDLQVIRNGDYVGFVNLDNFAIDGERSTIVHVDGEQHEAEVPFNLLDDLANLLLDGEVAIIQVIGYEGISILRYVAGEAWAVNSKGEQRYISIYDIYEQAKALGTNITRAEY